VLLLDGDGGEDEDVPLPVAFVQAAEIVALLLSVRSAHCCIHVSRATMAAEGNARQTW
jgi:hypothetical protein